MTEVCVARERARGLESRRSRRHASRALRHAFVGVSAACRGRFCCVLAPIGFLPFAARDGPRFAAGFARRGCGLPSLGFCEFRTQAGFLSGLHGSNREITGQIQNHGFFLLCILMTLIFSCHLSPTRAKRSFPVWPSFAAKWSSGIGVCSRISLHRDSRTV